MARRLHLDKRAGPLIEQGQDQREWLSTKELAAWLGVSTQWVELGRSKGFGPPYHRVGPNMIRYHKPWVLKWLEKRLEQRVGEMEERPKDQIGTP